MLDVPRIKLPMQIVGSSLAVIEQDSQAELEQCVETVSRYEVGDRDDVPEFGVRELLFRQSPEVTAQVLIADIERWEPRVALEGADDYGTFPSERLIEIATRRSTDV